MAGLLPPPAARRIMPTMPNVLHVIDADTPRDALDQLALLADERGRIVSIGPPPNTRRDLTVASVRRPLGSAVLAAHDLRRVALEPDVVHAWSPAAAQAARRAARAAGCGLVISLVTGRAVEAGSLGPLFKRLCTGRQRATLTVPTEHSRRVLLNRGLPAEAAAVLPPAAEPIGDRDARRRRTREQLGLGNRAVLLVAPAQMTRWAGHKYAAWVHGILRQIVDHVRLMLPGSGPVAQHVRFFANTTGYDDEVGGLRHGRRPRADPRRRDRPADGPVQAARTDRRRAPAHRRARPGPAPRRRRRRLRTPAFPSRTDPCPPRTDPRFGFGLLSRRPPPRRRRANAELEADSRPLV